MEAAVLQSFVDILQSLPRSRRVSLLAPYRPVVWNHKLHPVPVNINVYNKTVHLKLLLTPDVKNYRKLILQKCLNNTRTEKIMS